MSEHLQPALLLLSCFQTTANNLYLYLCTYLYQSLNPYLYDGRVSIRRRWSSPAFQPEPPGCPSPALLALQTMLMRPWIRRITALGSGDTQPAPDTALVHTWWGHHVVASWSVHANAAVNTDFDPRGGVNKRGPGCDECARWGRSLTCLMAPPFPSIMSHGGPSAGKETSSGFPGLCAQFTGRRLGL